MSQPVAPRADAREPSADLGQLGRIAAAQLKNVEYAGELAEARRAVVRRAVDDVTAAAQDTAPVVALHWQQAHGVLALALGGRFDAEAVDRLRGRTGQLRRLELAEMVVDCSRLQGCSTPLARNLAHLRGQMLADGIGVELRAAPDQLVAEITTTPREATSDTDLHDADAVGSPSALGHDQPAVVG